MNRVSRVSSRPSHVQERLIGALIPDALEPRDECASVPLPTLPMLSQLDSLTPAALLVSTTRMDRSGRIHERFMLRGLGWEPGGRLDMDTLHGMILIAAVPTGQHSCLPQLYPEQVMVIHPSVAGLLTTHYIDLIHTEQVPRPRQPDHPDPP